MARSEPDEIDPVPAIVQLEQASLLELHAPHLLTILNPLPEF
jgi:hypothetical protein